MTTAPARAPTLSLLHITAMTQLARLLLAAARRTPAQAHGLLAPALCALAAQSHHAQAVAHQIPAGWRGADARPISTSGFAASGLTGALEKEMKHEKAEYEKPDIIARGPPAPFSLEDTPGDTTISLTREFKGEQVRLDVSVNLQVGSSRVACGWACAWCPAAGGAGAGPALQATLPAGRRRMAPDAPAARPPANATSPPRRAGWRSHGRLRG